MTQTSQDTAAAPVCEVEICLFKPEGFGYTHIVSGEDRGKAVRAVLDMYGSDQLFYLNYVNVRVRSRNPEDKVLMI